MFYRSLYIIGCVILATLSSAARAQSPSPVSASFDFRNGALGWQAGCASCAPTDRVKLLAEIRSLPPELGNGTGLYIQGFNYSDALFMFLKRRLSSADGIVAGQTYRVNFTIVFASAVPTGCFGFWGSTLYNVYLKS